MQICLSGFGIRNNSQLFSYPSDGKPGHCNMDISNPGTWRIGIGGQAKKTIACYIKTWECKADRSRQPSASVSDQNIV